MVRPNGNSPGFSISSLSSNTAMRIGAPDAVSNGANVEAAFGVALDKGNRGWDRFG